VFRLGSGVKWLNLRQIGFFDRPRTIETTDDTDSVDAAGARLKIRVSSPRLPRLTCQRSAEAWSVSGNAECKVQNAKCQTAAKPLKAGVRSINISKSAVGGGVCIPIWIGIKPASKLNQSSTQHDRRRCFYGEVHRVCTRRACSQAGEWLQIQERRSRL
jgi:hypothetical protein